MRHQQEKFLFSYFTLEELKLCHRPKHSMRQDNTILRGMIVKHPIFLLWVRFLQFLFHLSKPLLSRLSLFFPIFHKIINSEPLTLYRLHYLITKFSGEVRYPHNSLLEIRQNPKLRYKRGRLAPVHQIRNVVFLFLRSYPDMG